MLRLYLVRHGQTAWNATGRYQGRIDIPLDERGRAQALALQPRLADVPFTAVYTSALSRAQETADLLISPAPHNGRIGDAAPELAERRPAETSHLGAESGGTAGRSLPRYALRAFDEMAYGEWEGRTRDEIATLFPENWTKYQANPAQERPMGGESRGELHARVSGALLALMESHSPGSHILLVAHGGTLRAIVAELLGLDLRGYRHLHFDNASLSILEACARPAGSHPSRLGGTVLLLNDTAHLEPVKEW
jgi:broad specificity phosphatase PhoE